MNENGIQTIQSFFNENAAENVVQKYKKAKMITEQVLTDTKTEVIQSMNFQH